MWVSMIQSINLATQKRSGSVKLWLQAYYKLTCLYLFGDLQGGDVKGSYPLLPSNASTQTYMSLKSQSNSKLLLTP